ncbi:hypothetical protein lbkm_2467 [Lachnospiraceae bacterium KM106-2]|nr:hypothetical protein lbkm_2467 [Lachnospiraceae bacterium KM106-2]
MKIKNIEGLSDVYLEQIEGTSEWYFCKQCEDSFCDLYEAEEIIKEKGKFSGATCYLIHYPDGEVFRPFEMRKNIYIEAPVWDNGKIGFLEVDFLMNKINVYYYMPEDKKLVKLAELPLESVEDCYNLRLKSTPLMLGRDGNEGKYEIIWPVRKTILMGDRETLMFRQDEKLYFNDWYENPEYHEEVVVRDINTGLVMERFCGNIYRMPDGTYWRI